MPSSSGSSTHGSRRVALLGAGYISKYHALAIRKSSGLELAAVCDPDVVKAEAVAAQHGIAHVFSSLDELAESGAVDGVHNLTPPDLHRVTTESCLRAGLDVFLEKPMAVDAAEARALATVASEEGRRLGVAHNFLYAHPYQQLRAKVRSGELGAIDHIDVVWNKPLDMLQGGPHSLWMLRTPTNILSEIGAHLVSAALDLLGDLRVVSVIPLDPTTLSTGVEFYRRWEILLAAPTGTTCRLRMSFVPGFVTHSVQLRSSNSLASVDYEQGLFTVAGTSRYRVELDRLRSSLTSAAHTGLQGAKNFSALATGLVGLSDDLTGYGGSITAAVQSFWSPGPVDQRLAAGSAVRVAELIEAIAQQVPRVGPSISSASATPGGVGSVASSTDSSASGPASGAALPVVDVPVVDVPVVDVPVRVTSPEQLILVTGGTGFIGKEVVRQLSRGQAKVRVLARRHVTSADYEVVRGDMNDPESLDRALEGVTHVVHLARGNGNNFAEFERTDVLPTMAFAELAVKHHVQRFVYCSSIAVYTAGSAAQTITEQTPISQSALRAAPYSLCKAVLEDRLLSLQQSGRLEVVIARPGVVLGVGSSPFHQGIAEFPHPSRCVHYGTGDEFVPIVSLADCADGIVAATVTPGIGGQGFNFCSPGLITAREYVDEVAATAGVHIAQEAVSGTRRFAAANAVWVAKQAARKHAPRPVYAEINGRSFASPFDCSRTESTLDWHPAHSREQLIETCVKAPTRAWFR